MTKQTLSISASDQVVRIQRVGGSLKVEGWDQQEIEATGDFVQLGRDEGSIAVSCAGDLELKAPRSMAFNLAFIGRSLEMKALAGPVEISFVGSDLSLRDLTGQVTIRGLVGGKTNLENVSRVATASSGPGPFGAGGEAAWRKIQKAMQLSEEQRRKLERKFQKAERKLNRVRVGIEHDGASWTWRMGPRPVQGGDAQPQASDEERATILRMLQEKKITAEEADRLLGALEGEGS
jgi:hypothetical protein